VPFHRLRILLHHKARLAAEMATCITGLARALSLVLAVAVHFLRIHQYRALAAVEVAGCISPASSHPRIQAASIICHPAHCPVQALHQVITGRLAQN